MGKSDSEIRIEKIIEALRTTENDGKSNLDNPLVEEMVHFPVRRDIADLELISLLDIIVCEMDEENMKWVMECISFLHMTMSLIGLSPKARIKFIECLSWKHAEITAKDVKNLRCDTELDVNRDVRKILRTLHSMMLAGTIEKVRFEELGRAVEE